MLSDGDPAGVTNALLQCLLEDRLAGVDRPDAEYQARFPGHADLVAAKLAQLNAAMEPHSGDAGASEPEPTEADPSSALAEKVTLGRYRLLQELGRGGQAVVHCAEDTQLRRRVALKVMPRASWVASPTALRRFRAEALLASRLDDPRICAVYDVGDQDEVTFIAMRLVEGEPLWKWISRARDAKRKGEPQPPWPGQALGRPAQPPILAFFEQAARALHRAHEAGVVHRDLKPGNLMLTPEGGPVVLDFGLAHDDANADPGLTATGDVFGTPAYMSPEQHRGDRTDRRTDVWSLGVALFETLTLERPFAGASRLALARAVLDSEPPDPRRVASGIDADLSAVLGTAIEKDLRRRYPTALEFAEELRRVRDHEPVRARPVGMGLRTWRWTQRNPMAAALLAVLSVGLAVVLSLLWQVSAVSYDEQVARDRLVASILATLEREAEVDLWPELPASEQKLAGWIERVDSLLALAPRLTEQLRGLDPEGTAAVDLRAGLVAVERVQAPSTGARARVQARLDFVRTVRARSMVFPASAWQATAGAVAGDARYGGLVLRPQLGLLPLGRDPASGLQEFAHLRSGRVPVRDAGGKLAVDGDTGIVFVLVPAGTWWIGAPATEVPLEVREGPPVEVDLPAYFIAKHEVTQGQWLRLAGSNPSIHPAGVEYQGAAIDLRHPVEGVNWHDADTWLQRHGLRLPDEEEWEAAARGGTSTAWWCGEVEQLQTAANLADASAKALGFDNLAAWDDRFMIHAPVGSFAANPFGLYDAHGNVAEWCSNSWYPYAKSRAAREQRGKFRMVRGGAYDDDPSRLRSAYRQRSPIETPSPMIGLRAARTLDL